MEKRRAGANWYLLVMTWLACDVAVTSASLLLPYGSSVGDTAMGTTEFIAINTPTNFTFYGDTYSKVYVSTILEI
jgi:hypothetical protein